MSQSSEPEILDELRLFRQQLQDLQRNLEEIHRQLSAILTALGRPPR